jgi:hypothetical protein
MRVARPLQRIPAPRIPAATVLLVAAARSPIPRYPHPLPLPQTVTGAEQAVTQTVTGTEQAVTQSMTGT